MQKEKTYNFFSIDVFVSFAILLGMLVYFRSYIINYMAFDLEIGIGFYAYYRALMIFLAFFVLLVRGYLINKENSFIWLGTLFVIFAAISTLINKRYPITNMPFKFITMFYWVAVMLVSYYAVIQLKTMKYHLLIVLVMFPILCYSFYIMRDSMHGQKALFNPVFYISFLMPTFFLLKNKLIKISGLILILIVVLLSYKRSAMLSYGGSIFVFMFYISKKQKGSQFWKKAFIAFGVMFFIILLVFSFKQISYIFQLDWQNRIGQMASDRGSGRLDIWLNYLRLLKEQSFPYWLYGHGYNATEVHGWAHNDILEVLYSFGLIGLLIYFLFIKRIFAIFFEMNRLNYEHVDAFAVSLVFFTLGTMVSQLVTFPYWFLNLTFFWGITIADFQNYKTNLYYLQYEEMQEYEYNETGYSYS